LTHAKNPQEQLIYGVICNNMYSAFVAIVLPLFLVVHWRLFTTIYYIPQPNFTYTFFNSIKFQFS